MAHLLIHRGLAKKNFTENTISAFKYEHKNKYIIIIPVLKKFIIKP